MEVQASAASHASWQPSRVTGTVDPNLPCTQHKGQQSPSWQWHAMTAVPQTSQCQDGRLARCGWLCSVRSQHAQPLEIEGCMHAKIAPVCTPHNCLATTRQELHECCTLEAASREDAPVGSSWNPGAPGGYTTSWPLLQALLPGP